MIFTFLAFIENASSATTALRICCVISRSASLSPWSGGVRVVPARSLFVPLRVVRGVLGQRDPRYGGCDGHAEREREKLSSHCRSSSGKKQQCKAGAKAKGAVRARRRLRHEAAAADAANYRAFAARDLAA